MSNRIGNIISDITNRPVYMLTERVDSDGDLSATCLVDGHFCLVEQYGDRLHFERVDSATQEIQGYAAGIAEAMGVRLDSGNPFDELAGYLRMDVKCSGGNKPCGKTCIPQRYQCRVKGGGGALNSGGGRKKLKSGGGIAKKAVFGGLSSKPADVAKRALVGGVVGGAGYVGIKSRDKIKEGIEEAKNEIASGKARAENRKTRDRAKTRGARQEVTDKISGSKEGREAAKGFNKGAVVGEKIRGKVFEGQEAVKTAGRVGKVAGKTAVAAVRKAVGKEKKAQVKGALPSAGESSSSENRREKKKQKNKDTNNARAAENNIDRYKKGKTGSIHV